MKATPAVERQATAAANGSMRATHAHRLAQRLSANIRNAAVLAAIGRVARESFLDTTMAGHSSDDVALPIGYAQTTSQPFVIARMLEMLMNTVSPPATILEVGAGCGYQTALLHELGYQVIALERIKPLAQSAQKRLKQLGYDGIKVIHTDGLIGYPQKSPYNGIVICAECQSIPAKLLEQMHPQGSMVLPLQRKAAVRLCLVSASGQVRLERESVAFVPMLEGVK